MNRRPLEPHHQTVEQYPRMFPNIDRKPAFTLACHPEGGAGDQHGSGHGQGVRCMPREGQGVYDKGPGGHCRSIRLDTPRGEASPGARNAESPLICWSNKAHIEHMWYAASGLGRARKHPARWPAPEDGRRPRGMSALSTLQCVDRISNEVL